MGVQPLALVVEDSEDQAELLRRHLDRLGFDVLVAPSAERAIEMPDEAHPVLAIVDLLLPGISGGELLAHLRAHFPDCLLVVSSVLDESDYPDADATLPKPVSGRRIRSIAERIGQ